MWWNAFGFLFLLTVCNDNIWVPTYLSSYIHSCPVHISGSSFTTPLLTPWSTRCSIKKFSLDKILLIFSLLLLLLTTLWFFLSQSLIESHIIYSLYISFSHMFSAFLSSYHYYGSYPELSLSISIESYYDWLIYTTLLLLLQNIIKFTHFQYILPSYLSWYGSEDINHKIYYTPISFIDTCNALKLRKHIGKKLMPIHQIQLS